MRKIKVLHIITRLIVGGAQEIALSMASSLDRDIFDVKVISGPQDFCEKMKERWGIDTIIVPNLIRKINPLKDLMALIKLYLFIKKNSFDIVHTHTSKAGILGRIAARLAGVPIIFHTPHGSIFHSIYYGPLAISLLSGLEGFVASFTDKIITCSESEKRDFLKHGIGTEDRYVIIYWGIKGDKFLKGYDAALKRRELGVPDETILLGNITRLVPEKGHIFCLEAFKIVVKKFPQAILLIAGEGILREKIEERISELGLGDNVIMTGHRDDVAEIFASLEISLHTSVWEGTPIAVIEAMLAGKTIIATRVGGIPELIEDGASGILVPPNDREALAEAIIKLINDKTLAKRMGEAARQRARERFPLELMIKKTTALYDSFVKSKDVR